MSETKEQRSKGWPKGIAAITLFVEDLEASKGFYQRAFGLPIVFEDPHSAVFRFGDTLVNLLKDSAAPELIEPARVAPAASGSRSVFTIQVGDVDAICADLQARGVALLNGPIDRPWGPRTASFSDPSGNIWEIAH
jgi:catechol 2,3-dioxygenase-like lactoylglutathione lyase family enzyme